MEERKVGVMEGKRRERRRQRTWRKARKTDSLASFSGYETPFKKQPNQRESIFPSPLFTWREGGLYERKNHKKDRGRTTRSNKPERSPGQNQD